MILRYWRTLRHLKLGQIYGRLLFQSIRPKPDFRPPPARRPINGTWAYPAEVPARLAGEGVFLLLNELGPLSEIGWNGANRSKLWRYNQHYFEDLVAVGSHERRDWHVSLLNSWLANNPPGRGDGWDPYPVSMRIVNWIKWSLAGNELPEEAISSLAIQARWLMKRLERHLLGNHLFANAKALVFAGIFFKGPEADKWRKTGLSILKREIPEQILDDGGHFELSPMYHAAILVDLLDLINILHAAAGQLSDKEVEFTSSCRGRIPAMLFWLKTMSHPDGGISFFNDAALGNGPTIEEIVNYAARLNIHLKTFPRQIEWLRDSGYIRLSNRQSTLVADVAPVGPDYLPGHAHADTLSFELSLNRQRAIVNSGTSVYGIGAERLRQRGTAAHSTLMIDGQDSSEVWAGFRVGRRARPFEVSARKEGAMLIAEGAHDGYRHLAGAPVHKRTWCLEDRGLMVVDRVYGAGCHRVELRFHLAPELRAEQRTDRTIVVKNEGGEPLFILSIEGETADIEQSSWHPQFGIVIPSQAILVHAVVNLPTELRTHIRW